MPTMQYSEAIEMYTIFILYFPFTNLLEYRDAFALFDKRGDGKIDSDQIGDVLRALNLNPTESDVKKIVSEIDPQGGMLSVHYVM